MSPYYDEDGMTDFDHLAVNGMVQQSAGKRRLDLAREVPSLVRRACDEAGKELTRMSPNMTPAAVWTLTAAGIIAAEATS